MSSRRNKKRFRHTDDESDESEFDEDYKPHGEYTIDDIKKTNRPAYNTLVETRLEILKTEPKITKILEEPLLIHDRARLLQLYEIYKTTTPDSEQWLELRNNVNKLFDECKVDNDCLSGCCSYDDALQMKVCNVSEACSK